MPVPRTCESFRRLDRRGVLRVGGLTAFGLGLGEALARRDAAASPSAPGSGTTSGRSFGRADSVILIWLSGGPSHLDLFDMKPDAPAEVRGEFRSIKSSLAGLEISELLPRTAQRAQQFAMLRGITHDRGEHEGAHVWMLTGYKPVRPFFALRDPSQDQPSLGSVVSHELGPKTAIPPYICLPQASYNGAFNAFLGRENAPFEVNGDPNTDSFEVRDLGRIAALDESRVGRRRSLLSRVDRPFGDIERISQSLAGQDPHYARAYDLVASAGARGAFELHREAKDLRDAYGRNVLGQSVLLARRLVEYGCRFVTVDTTYWGMYWDTHADNFKTLRDSYGMNLDGAYSALLADMERRGMLDRTLVLLMSEFGRTPKINAAAGRDHWPSCNAAIFAGAGIHAGQVIGASDREGAYPVDAGFTPEEVVATIYHLLGIPAEKEYRDHLNRPWRLATGSPIRELLA